MSADLKPCCRCGDSKPLTEFYADRRAVDGLFSACKSCTRSAEKARKDADPEKVRRRQRLYRAANLEKCRSLDRARHKRDRIKRNANTKEWAKRNPQKKSAGDRRLYLENREHRLANAKAWAQKNKSRVLTNVRNSKARRRAAPGKHTAADIQWLYKQQRGQCPGCRAELGKRYHVDHVVPIIAGGANDKTNLQLLCPTCNLQKNRKHPVVFMQERGYLL